jgi:hypothetical protein
LADAAIAENPKLRAQRDRYRVRLLDTVRALEDAIDELEMEGLETTSYRSTAKAARRDLTEEDSDE